ncbi:hypothetical protein Tco_0501967 [Tanacetum coccineum]
MISMMLRLVFPPWRGVTRIEEAASLSPSSFRKRYRSSYETPSPSLSPTLLIRKRYREDEGHGSEDEGPGLEDEGPGSEKEEEVAPEGQQQAVSAEDTTVDKPLGLGYGALRHHELVVREGEMPSTFEVDPKDGRVYTDILTYVPPVAPIQTPPSPEWSSGSLPVSSSSPAVSTPVASPVTTPAATIAVDEDEFLEVGAHFEFHGSILHDQIQRLDALPPTLFEGYDRDLRELYTRSGARENHDLRMQIAEERRERLELTYCVARMERRQESRGE